MMAKETRTFIDNFLIEEKSKETLEVRNRKECREWYNRAMQELDELERLAKIGRATQAAFSNGLSICSFIENTDGDMEIDDCIETENQLLVWYD